MWVSAAWGPGQVGAAFLVSRVLPAALGGRGLADADGAGAMGFAQGHECMLGVELPSQALPAGSLGCNANLALSGHLLVQCPWL